MIVHTETLKKLIEYSQNDVKSCLGSFNQKLRAFKFFELWRFLRAAKYGENEVKIVKGAPASSN